MTIRILCIVIAFIVAVWVNREDSNLYVTSECGCGYLAERTKPPVMLATIVPVVTPVRTGY